jgi:hypothetical protein
MKKLIAIGVLMMAGIAAYAQGSVNFANIIISGGERIVDAPIYEPNGTTLATGPAYMAQLYAGANAGSLAPVGAPAPFLTGGGAGYFSGGARTIEAVAPGADAVIQVRAWRAADGATWEEASQSAAGWIGESAIITVGTGGDGSPPRLPQPLLGLDGFNLTVVPEPSTIALGLLGLLGLAVMRRRK